ncbi:MAG: hypothetical protein L0Z51_12275, partial [Candidatus Latescibacteria bacterium]|nr:hypothetical protein [Candidatus Latescibacterota bacterium]
MTPRGAIRPGNAVRALAYAWALPTTVVGLALVAVAVTTGARAALVEGVLEAHGGLLDPFLRRGVPLRGGASAMTLGHVVVGRDPDALARTRLHVHASVICSARGGHFEPQPGNERLMLFNNMGDPYGTIFHEGTHMLIHFATRLRGKTTG